MILLAQCRAIGDRITVRLPVHVGDFFRRTKVLLGRPVAIETPAHAQRLLLINFFHFVHAAVARLTTHAPSHVGAVIEVHVVWQVVDLDPLDRLSSAHALAEWEAAWGSPGESLYGNSYRFSSAVRRRARKPQPCCGNTDNRALALRHAEHDCKVPVGLAYAPPLMSLGDSRTR